MKHWMLLSLLAASAVATAQTTAQIETTRADAAKSEADETKMRARSEADEAKTRAKLEEARARLDKAAREVAELSGELGQRARRDIMFFNPGDRRAVLGVQIDNDSDSKGARVLHVSPGGPAEEAGLRDGDVILSLDGKPISGTGNAGRVLIDQMRDVKPEQKLKVRVLRDGKNKDFVVVARPMMVENRVFEFRTPGGMGGPMAGVTSMGPMPPPGPMMGDGPMFRQFRTFFPGEFGGMELASVTPKLGAYFGVNEGVLVVKAPDDPLFKLEDGDVIQSIDGRKPDDGAHAMRILRSYRSGEKLNLGVLRQRKPITLAVTMPDRPEFEHFTNFDDGPMPPPPMPAGPSAPARPAPPGPAGVTGAPGTLE
jgi:S1-C subfamily serine protease